MKITIRDARPADCPAMLDIYNDVVATSTAIYCDDSAGIEFMEGYLRAREQDGFPVFVAQSGAGNTARISGYGSYGAFRPRPGYRFTVEHSVHTHKDMRGKGVGSALMSALIDRAKADGYRVMLGAVDAENEGSLVFHDRLGFTRSGVLKEVGRKFDRWLDVVFVQLNLE